MCCNSQQDAIDAPFPSRSYWAQPNHGWPKQRKFKESVLTEATESNKGDGGKSSIPGPTVDHYKITLQCAKGLSTMEQLGGRF